jgi:glycosyltransferase involved in cell wall biosynthesis
MNYGLPVSNSQVLISLTKKDDLNTSGPAVSIHEVYGQAVIREAFHFLLDNPCYKAKRSQFQLSEEDFLIAFIGNRLSAELTEEFKTVLQQICLLDPKVKFLIIGSYPGYLNYFSEPVFQDRIYNLGYQEELPEIIGIADLFLNPPRNGGGTSALISLYAGVPVVTLPDGDVAGNVGKDFICRDRQEMVATINRYLSDKEFYQRQKEIGLEYTNKLTDFKAYMMELIENVKEAIILTEKV